MKKLLILFAAIGVSASATVVSCSYQKIIDTNKSDNDRNISFQEKPNLIEYFKNTSISSIQINKKEYDV